MPQSDLVLYQKYAARRMFPGRRVELLLAQVSSVLAQVNGNKDARTHHFLFDPRPDEPEVNEEDADAAAEALNFKPRKRPQRTDNDGQ